MTTKIENLESAAIEKKRKRSRKLYIAEAAVEYFISLCVTTTFLTIILEEMQVPTAYQGIISSIASLACVVQLIAVFSIKKTYPCKRWICILNLANQLLFSLLYLVPLTPFRREIKLVIFVAMLLAAYCCQHYLTPSRTQWHMESVDDNKRGIFTANKEIISLVGGMIFSYAAAELVDYFKAPVADPELQARNMRICFIIFAVTIVVLALIHLFLMLGITEYKPKKEIPKKSFKEILGIVWGSRQIRLVLIFDILFAITRVPAHFASVYALSEKALGFSPVFVTVVHALTLSAFRAVLSRPLGRFADKHSWPSLLKLCMLSSAIAYLIFAFCAPGSLSYLLYPLYALFYGFSLAGSNSARVNLCLDYVSHEDRRYVLGVKDAISGLVEFGVTLLVSLLVQYIEGNGNSIFGMSIYAQQLLFFFNALLLCALALFMIPFLRKKQNIQE